MWVPARLLSCAVAISMGALAGCAYTPAVGGSERAVCSGPERVGCIFLPAEPRAGHTEQDYRTAAGEPAWATTPGVLGIALSGGGSKSAPFSLGVLAGLHDERLLLPASSGGSSPTDVAIASVSGGGYAAYHLFAQLVHADKDRIDLESALDRAYTDCVSLPNGEGLMSDRLRNSLSGVRCNRFGASDRWPQHAEQAKLRCAQDLLQPGECSSAHQSVDALTTIGGAGLMLVPTFLSLLPHHLFNTVFDSGAAATPSQRIYRDGIGITYGSRALPDRRTPASMPVLLDCPDEGVGVVASHVSRPRVANCKAIRTFRDAPTEVEARMLASTHIAPEPIRFAALRSLRAANKKSPFWIIQATAPRYRSLWGWFEGGARDVALDTFEFTPFGFGSRRYGFVAGSLANFDVLDATATSAAFFDSNQQQYYRPAQKGALGILQHLGNVSWGVDIPNYSVSDVRRQIHRSLPFPLYWLDSPIARLGADAAEQDRRRSSFIRLLDGGSSDNTGIYSLYRRGVSTIVLADAAQDTDGTFGDLCQLRSELLKQQPRRNLRIPGLEGFEASCDGTAPARWDLFGEWPHEAPVLLGCISKSETCDDSTAVESRLIVVKPRISWNGAGSENEFKRAVAWNRPDKGANACVHDGRLFPSSTSCKHVAAQCAASVPCEVATLLIHSGSMHHPVREKGFPQVSTVLTTVNSSGTLFAASRELGRHYTRSAAELIRDSLAGDTGLFARELKNQQANPIRRAKQ